MTGEEVPQDVLDAAQRGYSMHGAGLTANIVAAAWPAIEKHIRDRTPTGDPREAPAPCWLCGGLGGIAVHQEWSGRRGKPLWTAHAPTSRSHPVYPCPACPPAAEEAERQRDEALAAVQRVREIHYPITYGTTRACNSCTTLNGTRVTPWPCPTWRALKPKETS